MSCCDDLHVWQSAGGSNQGTWISEWRPTWGERLRLLLGGHVWLIAAGFQHPAAGITAESPFEGVRAQAQPTELHLGARGVPPPVKSVVFPKAPARRGEDRCDTK